MRRFQDGVRLRLCFWKTNEAATRRNAQVETKAKSLPPVELCGERHAAIYHTVLFTRPWHSISISLIFFFLSLLNVVHRVNITAQDLIIHYRFDVRCNLDNLRSVLLHIVHRRGRFRIQRVRSRQSRSRTGLSRQNAASVWVPCRDLTNVNVSQALNYVSRLSSSPSPHLRGPTVNPPSPKKEKKTDWGSNFTV